MRRQGGVRRAHLKVILETGRARDLRQRPEGLALRMNAGARFHQDLAPARSARRDLPVTLVMLEAIRDFYLATGKRIGMKPAGGIKTSKQALHLLVLVKRRSGTTG